MANISMDPRPTNYLRQNIVFSYPEMIRVSFSLFLCLSVFCYFTLLLIFIKIVLLLLLFYYFFFMKIIFACSGMFRILSTAPVLFSCMHKTYSKIMFRLDFVRSNSHPKLNRIPTGKVYRPPCLMTSTGHLGSGLCLRYFFVVAFYFAFFLYLFVLDPVN